MRKVIFIQALLPTIFWAGLFLLGKNTLSELHAIFVALMRFGIGAIILMAILALVSPKISQIKYNFITVLKENFSSIVIIGFTGTFIYNILFFIGLQKSNITHGVAFMASIPLWTTLLSSIFLREKIYIKTISGILLGFIGVFFILVESQIYGQIQLNNSSLLEGDIYYLFASIIFAIYILQSKKMVAHIPPLTATTHSINIGVLFLFIAAYFCTDLAQEFTITNENNLWPELIYMGSFGTAFAFFLWFRSISFLGPAKTSIFLNFVPVWGIILSNLFRDEKVNLITVIAIAFIIFGVFLVQTAGKKESETLSDMTKTS